MHFVTGGAYNGKRKWVIDMYNLTAMNHSWISAYKNDSFICGPRSNSPAIAVLEGAEKWIRDDLLDKNDADKHTVKLRKILDKWLHWECQDEQNQLIIIGTDITKGIVPIDQQDRLHRDITGWIYQYLAKNASQVDIIWYGIAENIK